MGPYLWLLMGNLLVAAGGVEAELCVRTPPHTFFGIQTKYKLLPSMLGHMIRFV